MKAPKSVACVTLPLITSCNLGRKLITLNLTLKKTSESPGIISPSLWFKTSVIAIIRPISLSITPS